jgi:chlorobactene glucosyltransferase
VARAALTHLCALAALVLVERSLRATRGWLTVPPLRETPPLPTLSAVVPARDEERSIERCVRSLLAQTIDVEVIVVDDRSRDATPGILERLRAEFPQLRVVHGEPLPDGWVGKPWALAQGARVARGAWLLFTDADTWHAPEACASTLAFARARGVDALSLWTFQELGTFAERAVLPAILGMVLLAGGSFAEMNDPYDPLHALANGQYILVERRAYDALGGHTALRGELVDDVEFARRVKSDGRYRIALADGAAFVRVRMYHSFGEIWAGFTKNIYAGAKGKVMLLAAAAFWLALLSVVPAGLAVDAAIRRRPLRALEALLVLANVVAVASRAYRRTRVPQRYAWWAPLGFAVGAAITLNSTLSVVSGRGVAWRGRRYSGRPADP